MRGFRAPQADPPGRIRSRSTLGLGAALACAGLISACGSSKPAASGTQSTCNVVSAVLANGPDPDADPVGYAQAQILPLRQIHTSDSGLHSAIDGLASAYQAFYNANGAKPAQAAVNKAADKVSAICPGATS